MNEEYPHRELSGQIIGAAMNVLNGLKPGLDEKIYENALVLELIAQGHRVDQQKRFPVYYRDHLIGTLVPDILVNGQVIVDPKVVAAFADDHISQMLGYLAITGLDLAMLINFKYAKLQWKRVVRNAKMNRKNRAPSPQSEANKVVWNVVLKHLRSSALSAVKFSASVL